MEVTGELIGISRDFESNKLIATFHINESNEFINQYENLKSYKLLDIVIKKFRKKRSIDANNYAWQLISKIAAVIKSDKDSVYEIELQKYGVPYVAANGVVERISVLSEINLSKLHIHTKFIGKNTIQGKEFSHYILIKGSSEYDTKEMSDFIDGVVSDAKELGIETMTPAQIEQMKRDWESHTKKG